MNLHFRNPNIYFLCCINWFTWKWYTWHRKAYSKNSSKLNKFLHSEVNQLIQHIIDGQNNIYFPYNHSSNKKYLSNAKVAILSLNKFMIKVDGFFQDVKMLSAIRPGGTLSWGSLVWDFRLVKEPPAWKNRTLSKI